MAIQLPRRGDGADGRAMITGPPCLQDRGVPPGRIGADDTGQRIEARFVSEKDRLPRRWRPFWSAGQGSWRQRAIAPSSRWRARRAGCCRLHWIALHKRSYTFSLRIIQLPENQVASLRFADLRGGTRDGTRTAVLHALDAWNPGALYGPALGLATAPRSDQLRHHTGDEAFTSAYAISRFHLSATLRRL
jgi:hypothetical protein